MLHRLVLRYAFGAIVLIFAVETRASDFTDTREACQKWKSSADPALSALAERFLRDTGARNWRDSSGEHTVEAEIVDYGRAAGGKSWAKLRKRDGTEVTVSSEKLSSYCQAHLSDVGRLLARLMLRRASTLPLTEFYEQLERIDASPFMKFKAICAYLRNSGVESLERPAAQFLEDAGIQRWEVQRTNTATRTIMAEWVDYLESADRANVVILERKDGSSMSIPVTDLGWESRSRVKRLTNLAAKLGATLKAARERLDGEKLLELHDNPENYVGMSFTLTVWINGSTITEVTQRSSEGVALLDGYVLELRPAGHDPNTAQGIGNSFGLQPYKLSPFLSSKRLARLLKEICGSGVYRKFQITFTVLKATDSRGRPCYLAAISEVEDPKR